MKRDDNIIESWSFSQQEWNLFVSYERRNKIEDNIYFAIATTLVGIPVVMYIHDASFFISTSIVFPFVVIISLLRTVVLNKHLKRFKGKTTVDISYEFLKINDVMIYMNRGNKKIKNVKIIDSKNGVKLLEFVIEWKTRRGYTNYETRIPIPHGKKNRAEELVSCYLR